MPRYAYEPLSQLDNAFLIFERRESPMHVAALQIYEAGPLAAPGGGLDVERLRDYIASRLHRIPRYRQRLEFAPLDRHPVWVDDARFNLFYHVRHTRLPRPGDERQLKRLVGRIQSQRLDRGKPLWEMWVIEGLAGDRFAVLSKTHHCMIDGISGVDVMSVLMTPEPTTAIERPPPWVPRPLPSRRELGRDELLRRAALPLRAAGGLLRLGRDAHARHDAAERLRAAGRVIETGLRNASNTPLNQPVGPYRRFDWFALDLDDVRSVRKGLGGTVNDVVLASVAGGMGRFLRKSRHLELPGLDFRAMAPVSLRSPEQQGTLGNRVSTWTVPLPVAERDPRRRLDTVRRTTGELKATQHALGAETLTRASEWTGSTLLSLGSRLSTWGRPFNLVVTNVPGPRTPLYLLEAPMLEAYPIVPLFGNLAVGIALFSYVGRLYWGVMGDWDVLPDLHDLVLDLEHGFRELAVAASRGAHEAAAPAPPQTQAG